MATKRTYATVEQVEAINAKIDAIISALNVATVKEVPIEAKVERMKANAKAARVKAEKEAKEARQDMYRIKIRLIGKPSKAYVDFSKRGPVDGEPGWVWCKWETKPTAKTIERLKAAGWVYSSKRKAWHHVNA